MANKSTTSRPALNKLVIARLAAGIGALGLIASLTLFLIQRELSGGAFVGLLIGVIGVSIWLTLTPDDLRNLITFRQAVYGTNSIFAVVLLIGVMVLLYGLASTANLTADLTARRTYSLRPDVSALIRSLSKPAMITVFYTVSDLPQLSSDQPILRMFRDAAPDKIKINVVDPDQSPVIAQRFNANPAARVFVTDILPDGSPDVGEGKTVQVTGNVVGEQQIADSLLLLQARGKFKVVFTVGHDEVNKKDEGGDVSFLWNGLRKVGMTVSTLDILLNDIPADTSALVMAAPKKDLTEIEVDRVRRYLGNGGRLMILAEPNLYVYTNAADAPLDFTFLKPDSPFAKYLWEDWGVRADAPIIFDPDPNAYIDSPYNLIGQAASPHPVLYLDKALTRPLSGLFTLARPISARLEQQGENVRRLPLIRTSNQAFGALNIRRVQVIGDKYVREERDVTGPFSVGFIAENTLNKSRLILMGDADWARNDLVVQSGNAQLWSNMMDWLTQYQEKTSVSPVSSDLPVTVSNATLNAVVVITLILLPGAVLALGGFVWWNRARR
jgi:hypothetical protein